MNTEFTKKQNKKVTVFACLLSVLSIGLLIFGFTLVSSDKVVMLQSISNLSNRFHKQLENSNSLLDKLSSSKDIGIRSNIQLSYDDTSAGLSFDYLENREDKNSKLALDVLINNESLLGADLALSNDKLYFFIDDITPRYYHTVLEYFSFLSGLSSNDYDKILALLKEAVTDYLDNQDITKEKVNISYNSEDKKVNKLTYEITNKTIKDIVSAFISSLKKDNNLLEDIALYLQLTKDETIQQLDKFIASLDYEEVTTQYYYRVYYYGFNQIVAYELEEVESEIIFQYKIDNKETITISQAGIQLFSLEISKNKNQDSFEGFFVDNNSNKYSFSGSVMGDTMTMLLEQGDIIYKLSITTNSEEKENQYYYQSQIVASMIIEQQESTIFTLDMDLEYYFNQKVSTMDLENSVDISEISEEDLAIIQNNIMNHPIYQLFYNLSETIGFSL